MEGVQGAAAAAGPSEEEAGPGEVCPASWTSPGRTGQVGERGMVTSSRATPWFFCYQPLGSR